MISVVNMAPNSCYYASTNNLWESETTAFRLLQPKRVKLTGCHNGWLVLAQCVCSWATSERRQNCQREHTHVAFVAHPAGKRRNQDIWGYNQLLCSITNITEWTVNVSVLNWECITHNGELFVVREVVNYTGDPPQHNPTQLWPEYRNSMTSLTYHEH